MDFYFEWSQAVNTYMEGLYIKSFLDSTNESMDTLLDGSKEDAVMAIKLLLSVPIEKLIDCIRTEYTFESKDIFQYSKLDDAVSSVCNILEFDHNGLSFFELGQRLTHAPQEFACIKYGENHAKMARELSLVKFIKSNEARSGNHVFNTALGSVSTSLSSDEKMELVRRLAIRNPFVKTMVYKAKEGLVSYKDVASEVLTGQTIIRRKHNVEIVVKLILHNSKILENIGW